MSALPVYRGRLAPSPTGFLHLGHARTFWTAQERARQHNGVLILRSEDLDSSRVRPDFESAIIEDLQWFGLTWQEGPDCGGPYGPYTQSKRMAFYRRAMARLVQGGLVYPCHCTRKDIQSALSAPHAGQDEILYPGTCRPVPNIVPQTQKESQTSPPPEPFHPTEKAAWRFRVPEGRVITFIDASMGPQSFQAGKDFGDFVVWRNDDLPAYQLAVVVDDAAMQITEVVRGADLLVSTARQWLLYEALGLPIPAFYHCPLVLDATGQRLAKRNDALSLRTLREQGWVPGTF